MNWIIGFIVAKVKDYVLANWKTTLVGLVGAMLVKYIPDEQTRSAVLAGFLGLLGLVAKDGDKTGTTAQPREPEPVAPAPVGSTGG